MSIVATINSFQGYQGTTAIGTPYVGYYSSANFVGVGAFTPSETISAGLVTIMFSANLGSVTDIQFVCQISTSSTEFINANGPQGSGTGRATGTISTAGIDAYSNVTFQTPYPLNAGTQYYLWLYPNGTSYTATGKILTAYINSANGEWLDINGWLDGSYNGKLTGYGTCDVYINGSKAGTNVDDWWHYYPSGTTYSIQNITPTAYHTYQGVHSGSLSGTINTTRVNVELSFNTNTYTITTRSETDFVTVSSGGTWKYGSSVTLTATVGSKTGATTSFDGWYLNGTRVSTNTSYTITVTANATYTAKGSYTWNNYYLDLNGLLDGTSSGGIWGYGTCDVYINGTKVATGISDYYQQHTYGSSYQFTNIQPTLGSTYVGVSSGSLTGTIGASTTTVVLQFKKNSNITRIPYINNSNTYKTYMTYVYENGAWVGRSVHIF